MDPNVRLVLGWTGQALMYMTPVLSVLVIIWFYSGLSQRHVRVTETQGLVLLAGAVGCFGVGLSLIALSYAPLIPLALGIIALSLVVAAYGVKLFRARS